MLRTTIVSLLLFSCSFLSAQVGVVSGVVLDEVTGESLIGANVVYAPGKGVPTDFDGRFSLELPYGTYELSVSYIGYLEVIKVVTLSESSPEARVSFNMNFETLAEIEVVGDRAIARKTPVAFTNVPIQLIEEELGSQDLPMVLNSTPGIQATQQGGGDGDARVSIRGFKQRDIAVMIDGVPVNDMENGWVYWSNWFGLDVIQSSMQVQRGLGASKVAIPSVGGTINILTDGIGQKKFTKFKQEVGNNGFLRTTLGYNSGRLKNGWGYSVAGSYKRGNGWVDGLDTEGYFYYGKVQKELGDHLISFYGYGAPQKHGQRSQKENMALYDANYAIENGVDTSIVLNYDGPLGIDFNAHYGELETYTLDDSNMKQNIKSVEFNDRQNEYHKPQFNLRDYWRINDKMALTNIAYLSIGRGGGVRLNGFTPRSYYPDGSPNYQELYDINTGLEFNPFVGPNIDPAIHPTEHFAFDDTFLRRSVNNHDWYGVLSKLSWSVKEGLDLSAGLDYRRYRGEHYAEVHDLFGADYYKVGTDDGNLNINNRVLREGDKFGYHNDSFVRWFGGYTQAELSQDNWSAFVNVSGALSQYKRIDYHLPKIFDLGDTTIAPFYDYGLLPETTDSVFYEGMWYTPETPGSEYQQLDWFSKWGATVKMGFNYNFTERVNGFVNLGYLSRNPYFNNIFDFGNTLLTDIKNSKVSAVEMGWSYKSQKFSSNINAYYTFWKNRPLPGGLTISDPEDPQSRITVNIAGMNAKHLGVEWDFVYKPVKDLEIQGVVSIGDWIWDSKKTVFFNRPNGQPVYNADGSRYNITFDAEGVHVGDAAQTQFGSSIKYDISKRAYIKFRYTYFDRYFSDFDPSTLVGDDEGRESWQIPAYGFGDIHAGYKFKVDKYKFSFRLSVLNAFDATYVSDADNNVRFARTTSATNFDAQSAGVYFGQGRRFNTSLTLTF
ncbi:MAG: TonB-dependent receptor [Flavobacteriales bacterium]|nr:TonB-dependent receptor [Flavobacteriales bacterium]